VIFLYPKMKEGKWKSPLSYL